ncbi:adenosine deaminase [Clostridium akagii]|uniref:adenosine deaminase n=1 Tax=Clostridium akagii TaxID=91623 RepID=UPI00047C0EC4|nr:adenosine deaminase [Clostridium akagii]
MDIQNIINNIPKVELHCHIDGSIRPKTILELALTGGIDVPFFNIEEAKRYLQITGECNSLKDYLDKFHFPVRVMQKKINIYRIIMELIEDSKMDGIMYTELRLAPLQHLKGGLSPEEVVETVLEAMKDGKDKFGVVSVLILCSLRHEPVEKSIEVVKLARKYISKGVVAIDLAGNESDFPPEIHKKAFDLAYEYGINITVHAGETGICANILKSIIDLHATRIGHGVFAYKDDKTLVYLIDNHIPLEMCPTSNLQTKAISAYCEHPIRTYLKNGINVTLNTDNRTVSNITLTEEYMNLISKLDFSMEEILQLIRNGINSAFASKQFKTTMLEKFNTYVRELPEICKN